MVLKRREKMLNNCECKECQCENCDCKYCECCGREE